MSGRLKSISLLTVVVTVLAMSGCLFGGAGQITSLELGASAELLGFGETVGLSAQGKTEKGKTVTVIPKWEIISGAGTLGDSEFQASDWDYEGDVVLRATYNGVSAEITLTIQGLLRDYPDPFPQPSSAFASLPAVTEEYLVKIGEPVDYFVDKVWLLVMNRQIWGWGRFVWDGTIMLPDDPSPATWINPKLYEEIPEIPRLSHKVRFELIESMVLARGTNYDRSVSHEKGTTYEEAVEMASRITSETHAEAGWSWGKVETTLTMEFTKRTQQSIKIEQKEKVTRTWSFVNPNDRTYYLYSSWNKVDIFYLSDSNGVPLEESPIFEGYGFHSYPVEIRGGTVVQKTWAFD